MSIADSLINYPQAPKLKTNYAANALQNLQQSGNPFAGIASAFLSPFAAKTDRDNAQALQQYAQQNDLANTLMNWGRQDELAQRQRNWDLQDAQTARENKLADALEQYRREDEVAQRNRDWELADRAAEFDNNMGLIKAKQEGDLPKALLDYQNKDKSGGVFGQEYQKQRGQQYAQMQKDIAEGRGNLDALKQTVDRALELNKMARSGLGGNFRQSLGRMFGGGEQTTAGAELQGLMKNELVGQLKKVFGGNITEGEREYLNQLYAADLSMSEGEREALIRNLYGSAVKRQKASESAFDSLFGTQPQTPQEGQEMDGYVFLGGDPSNPKNWRAKQ